MSYPESRVLVLATGGTIMMVPSEDGLQPAENFAEKCLVPRPSFNDGFTIPSIDIAINANGTRQPTKTLRTPLSKHQRFTRYCVYEFGELLDSSEVDAGSWNRIAELIMWNYRVFDGFVILHGTDTMAYTASALSFMLSDLGKPVILTGSQAAMSELGTDATDNLLGALIIAGHFTIPEVSLYFNYQLFRGNRSTKTSATDFGAFASPNHLPLATVSSAGARVFWRLVYRPQSVRPVTLSKGLDTAQVACLRLFPGIQPSMLHAVLLAPGLRGLILETFGAGNAPKGESGKLMQELAAAVRRGVVIVNVTQCLSGKVSPLYAPAVAMQRIGVVLGYDMTTEAALTKLAYLLSLDAGKNATWVARQMTRNLRGELTEQEDTEFRHPDEVDVTPKRAHVAALKLAIEDGNFDVYNMMMSREDRVGLHDSDEDGNTPLHMAATGQSIAILNDLLSRGASVHARNKQEQTPLQLAIDRENKTYMSELENAGAYVSPV